MPQSAQFEALIHFPRANAIIVRMHRKNATITLTYTKRSFEIDLEEKDKHGLCRMAL